MGWGRGGGSKALFFPPPPPPPPPYNEVEYDMKNYADRGESYQRPKAEVDDKGSPREVEDR